MKIALILALLLMPIVNAVSDTTPPSIVSFDFEPKVVDVSKSDQTIRFRAQIKDDLSGFGGAQGVHFDSPSGKQHIIANFFEGDLVLGDMLNGTYVDYETIPEYSENGEWHIAYFIMRDKVNNFVSLNTTELEKFGFPTVIEVKS